MERCRGGGDGGDEEERGRVEIEEEREGEEIEEEREGEEEEGEEEEEEGGRWLEEWRGYYMCFLLSLPLFHFLSFTFSLFPPPFSPHQRPVPRGRQAREAFPHD